MSESDRVYAKKGICSQRRTLSDHRVTVLQPLPFLSYTPACVPFHCFTAYHKQSRETFNTLAAIIQAARG